MGRRPDRPRITLPPGRFTVRSFILPGPNGWLKPSQHRIRLGGDREMRCTASQEISELPERIAKGYRRFRCHACGKQFNERSGGILNRAQYPSARRLRRRRPRPGDKWYLDEVFIQRNRFWSAGWRPARLAALSPGPTLTTASAFPPRSSAMLSGCITVSASACETLNSCWLSADRDLCEAPARSSPANRDPTAPWKMAKVELRQRSELEMPCRSSGSRSVSRGCA
jgi:hypothetical protein